MKNYYLFLAQGKAGRHASVLLNARDGQASDEFFRWLSEDKIKTPEKTLYRQYDNFKTAKADGDKYLHGELNI